MEIESVRSRIRRLDSEIKLEIPKFSVKYIDSEIDPLEDFFLFSNGIWVRNNEIPPEKSFWGASMELYERNLLVLGKILEECAMGGTSHDPVRDMVGKFYLSAMDTETIEALKFEPIETLMDEIDSVTSVEDLLPVTVSLHKKGIPVLFSFESSPDDRNSSIYAFRLSQGGISLPNRDYYFDDSFENIRIEFRKHMKRVFSLYGLPDDKAESYSAIVFDIETRLAEASRSPVELRDSEKNYNRMNLEEIPAMSKDFSFAHYFGRINLPKVDYVVVGQPEFFNAFGNLAGEVPIDKWKVYLKWKVLHFSASYLHEDMEKENFDFYHKILLGKKTREKRWKQVVSIIDMNIGEALGRIYVENEFGEKHRMKMATLVDDIREVFTERLKSLDWMSEETRKKALEKFSKFRAKIGHPTKYIDYSSIRIEVDDFLGNVMRSNEFEFNREVSRVNSPVDRELWLMTPPTVNAYFSPTENEIVFPAGILQPPFFDPDLDDAVNYGSIGGTIAHEITHGFDDDGRKYDADGNLNEWWTESDLNEFLSRSKKVVDLYNALSPLPEIHVNGELTLGENIADLGGVSIAFEALQRHLERNPALRKDIDGYTPEQRFFLGWSQSWREKTRDEALKWQVSNDPHSPDKFRGDIPARVHPEFEKHFKVLSKKKTTGLDTITIW